MGVLAQLERTSTCGISDIHGTAACFLDRTWEGSTLHCRVTHNIPQTITVQIRAGVTGPVLFAFDGESANGFYLDQRFSLDADDDDLEEAELLSGKWTIVITSSSCIQGALTGQLSNTMNLYAHLQGRNQIMNNPSAVEGLAVGRYSTQSQRIDNFLQFAVEDLLYTQIVLSTSLDAPLHFVYAFDDNTSPVQGPLPLPSRKAENQLYHREYYYQVLTRSFPQGEISGRMQVLDAEPEANFAFLLVEDIEDQQLVRGCALFSLLCDGSMEYIVSHEMEGVVNADMVITGTSQVLFSLNGMRSPIIGKQQLVRDEVVLLLLEQVELTLVLTTPTVNISGSLAPAYPFYSYISGSQHVPRQSVFERGCAVYDYDLATRELHYYVYHNLEEVTSVEFYSGDFGVNGLPELSVNASSGAALSGRVILTEEQQNSFFLERMYVQITDGARTIRGQLLYSTPHCFEINEQSYDLLDLFSKDTNRYYSSSPFFSNPSSPSSVLLMSWTLLVFVLGVMMM